MVSDESVVDQETSERLLDFSERPELKRLLDQFDVVKVEVSKNKKCMRCAPCTYIAEQTLQLCRTSKNDHIVNDE